MILVILKPRQTGPAGVYNQAMQRPRIAIIGDTRFRDGEWIGAGAIVTAPAFRQAAEVGLRTVAANHETARLLRTYLESAGVTPWLTVRTDAKGAELPVMQADVRMGDPLQIPHLFDHDVIVLACRDVRLRRFLADLPVHTRPDVRIIACLHAGEEPVTGERLEDLLRFDTLVGSEDDFRKLTSSLDAEPGSDTLALLRDRMHGSNLRAAIAWNSHGAFSLAAPNRPIMSIPPHALAAETAFASWPAFVGAVALGIARRDPWDEIGRSATDAYARPSYT